MFDPPPRCVPRWNRLSYAFYRLTRNNRNEHSIQLNSPLFDTLFSLYYKRLGSDNSASGLSKKERKKLATSDRFVR